MSQKLLLLTLKMLPPNASTLYWTWTTMVRECPKTRRSNKMNKNMFKLGVFFNKLFICVIVVTLVAKLWALSIFIPIPSEHELPLQILNDEKSQHNI